jgi:NitT/TauT family transport system substrate-binding protein
MKRLFLLATLATLALAPAASAQDGKPEKTDIKIAVGGKSFMIYLPLTVTGKGEIDALSHADPAIGELEASGDLNVVVDTRTTAGTHGVWGGDYPSSVFYFRPDFIARNPNTVQAVVTATVRALRWIDKASPEEIAKVMPPEYAAGNPKLYVDIIAKSKAMYPPDGRVNKIGAENAYEVLRAFDPAVGDAKVDLAATYTDRFVDKAPGDR